MDSDIDRGQVTCISTLRTRQAGSARVCVIVNVPHTCEAKNVFLHFVWSKIPNQACLSARHSFAAAAAAAVRHACQLRETYACPSQFRSSNSSSSSATCIPSVKQRSMGLDHDDDQTRRVRCTHSNGPVWNPTCQVVLAYVGRVVPSAI